jgi:hypothetical protein
MQPGSEWICELTYFEGFMNIVYIFVQDFLPYKLEAMNGLICKLV